MYSFATFHPKSYFCPNMPQKNIIKYLKRERKFESLQNLEWKAELLFGKNIMTVILFSHCFPPIFYVS